jgi:hypothetical protein
MTVRIKITVSVAALALLTVSHSPHEASGASGNQTGVTGQPLISSGSGLSGGLDGESLIGCWRMESDTGSIVQDASGFGNHGTIMGAPLRVTGKIGRAMEFDGIDDYVLAGRDPSLDISDALTVIAWIYAPSFPYIGTIIHRWYDGTQPDRGFAFQIREGAYVRFGVGHDVNLFDFSFPFETNRWYHVAGVWDGNTMTVYVDGDTIGTLPTSGPYTNQDVDLAIGVDPMPLNNYFRGKIDEVRIYKRALSQTEIQYALSGLLGYWPLDECGGTTAPNVCDMENHGELINGPVWVNGKFGNALEFDGATNYVVVSPDPRQEITNGLTAMAWVYPRSFPHTANTIIHRWYDNTDPDRGFALQLWQGNAIRFGVISDDNLRDVPYPLQANAWYHIAGVWDDSVASVYINGTEIDSWETVGTFTNQNIDMALGVDPYPLPIKNYFDGIIDEARLYGRALTSDEIAAVYSSQPCACPCQSDLDGDGFLTSLDLSTLIDILFSGHPDIQLPECPSPRADFDCDGYSTSLDLAALIDHLFASGPGPCDPCLQ